jgi:hypothetical protein
MTFRQTWLFYRWVFLVWRDTAKMILRCYREWEDRSCE